MELASAQALKGKINRRKPEVDQVDDEPQQAIVADRGLWWEMTAEASGVGFWHWKSSRGELQLTASCKALFGLPGQHRPTYSDLLRAIHPDDQENVDSHVRKALRSGSECEVEFRVIWPDGSIRWLLSKGRASVSQPTAGKQIDCVVVDVTNFKEAERVNHAQVQAQHDAQLRLLASELSHAEQHERARLAQLLHDHLQQLLVAARFQVRHLGRLRRINREVAESFQTTEDLLMEAIQACRSLATELSPLVLDQGLRPALEWLALWMREKHGLVVQLRIDTPCEPADRDIQLILFQSVQELLFNVVKHAHVRKAWVAMESDSTETVRLSVSDRGAGFDPTATGIGHWASQTGFGLLSIRRRLESIGGSMEIRSLPGEGTEVALTAPSG